MKYRRLPETVVLDALVDAIRRETDPEARKALAKAAVEAREKEHEAILKALEEEEEVKN